MSFSRLIKYASLLVFSSLVACEEVVDWPLQESQNAELVVEAIVTNEFRRHEILLTQTYPKLNDLPEPVINARVFLSSPGQMVEFLLEDSSTGAYRAQVPFAAGKDIPYTLVVHWNNQEFRADSRLSFVSPMPPINFDPVGPNLYKIEDFAPVYHPLEQAMYQVNISWKHLLPSAESEAQLLFYTFSTIDGNQLVRPKKEGVIFPRGSIVIVRKFGLDAAFGDYLRTMVMETEWQGGAFDEASSSLNSNISGGAHGFFSVCAVIESRFIVR